MSGPGELIKLLLLAASLGADTDPWLMRRADEHIQQLLFGKSIVREAKKHLGEPYVWGGKDSARDGGLDCSGFTHTVFGAYGIKLPRMAQQQYQQGIAIERPALNPGDLVFFLTGSVHVGIYLGDGEFIHAPGSGKRIKTESIHRGYFAQRYIGARRYLPPPKSKPTTTRETKP